MAAAAKDLNVEVPGEAPAAPTPPPALDPSSLLAALSPDERSALLSAAAAQIAAAAQRAGVPVIDDPAYPDESEVDPAKVPFGTATRVKQGWVVSSAPDPRNLPK